MPMISVLELFPEDIDNITVQFHDELMDHLRTFDKSLLTQKAPKDSCLVCNLIGYQFNDPFHDPKNLSFTKWSDVQLEEVKSRLLTPGENKLVIGLFDPRLSCVNVGLPYLSRHDCDAIIVGPTVNQQEQEALESMMKMFAKMGQVAIQVLSPR